LHRERRNRRTTPGDLDTTIAAMAMTAKDMNAKYKETSEAGLVALVLC
jgi:L-serine dehydratase